MVRVRFVGALIMSLLVCGTAISVRAEHASGAGTPVVVAQAQDMEQGELSPRYEPVPPHPPSAYNSDYLFGMTRGVAQSTVHPAAKVPLFVLTVPLDIVFLPFAAIGGFFG